MKLKSMLAVGAVLVLSLVQEVVAEEITLVVPEEGSVSEAQGLEAWARIFEVVSHPRCANCHVGASDRPMWSGPSYGKARPHGMNIRAGESRFGAETIPCTTCHLGETSDIPHTPPAVGASWRLGPVEAEWFGKDTVSICTQLRNPDTNGDRSFEEIAGHLGHDLVLRWAWNPGGGREPAPYSLQEHANDVLTWGAAGMPCPEG